MKLVKFQTEIVRWIRGNADTGEGGEGGDEYLQRGRWVLGGLGEVRGGEDEERGRREG